MASQAGEAEFEPVDLESANVYASFDNEAQALALVREAIARHGEPYIYTWALGRIARSAPVKGAALAALAKRMAA
ncbi:MAG TPA: hypothetical protein VKV26_02990 [Dehalococcoidia bacterium]|nr:hypothetical protein [Dehalococcoidia bacterium]